MRGILTWAMGIVGVGLVLFATVSPCAEPNSGEKSEPASSDPWVGEYVKLGGFDFRKGNAAGVPRVTITKAEGGYRLSGELYETYLFKPDGKGMLKDERGIFGALYLGTVEYSDGRKARVIRGEFCYEQCLFYQFGVRGSWIGQ